MPPQVFHRDNRKLELDGAADGLALLLVKPDEGLVPRRAGGRQGPATIRAAARTRMLTGLPCLLVRFPAYSAAALRPACCLNYVCTLQFVPSSFGFILRFVLVNTHRREGVHHAARSGTCTLRSRRKEGPYSRPDARSCSYSCGDGRGQEPLQFMAQGGGWRGKQGTFAESPRPLLCLRLVRARLRGGSSPTSPPPHTHLHRVPGDGGARALRVDRAL